MAEINPIRLNMTAPRRTELVSVVDMIRHTTFVSKLIRKPERYEVNCGESGVGDRREGVDDCWGKLVQEVSPSPP